MTSYDDKVRTLAGMLSNHITFISAEDARELTVAYKRPADSAARQRLDAMAESFFRDAGRLRIRKHLQKIGGCDGTRLSALREAIRICAQRHLEAPAPGRRRLARL